jgi:LysR family glycine cleavage system transcriptional activator
MRRLPPFTALRAFESAARLGGFTFAGVELHQTPSAISHQIHALEDWFQRPLFTRLGRRVALTEDGRRLLGEISQAFDLIENACAVLRPSAQRMELAVHSAPSFAAKWLGPRLPLFIAAHPKITIHLTSSAESANLEGNLVDIDIAYGEPPHVAGTIVEPLGKELTVPMCSQKLVDSGQLEHPKDLLALTLIDSKLNPVQWADWWRLHGLKMPSRARPSFDRGALAIAAAVDGLGVALETIRFAESELASGHLTILDGPKYPRIERQTHFLRFKRVSRNNPQIQAFRFWLYSQLGLLPTYFRGHKVAPSPKDALQLSAGARVKL